jgi:AAA+ superfamily predicted ATPase
MAFPSHFIRTMMPARGLSGIAFPPDTLGQLEGVVSGIRAGAPSGSASVVFFSGGAANSALATEAIAHDLGRNLLRVDLAAVVSKHIGETEKNLDIVFKAASEVAGSILFFDEADPLFGTRTEAHDAHDHFANIEVNFLMQRIESLAGVAVFATTLPVNSIPGRFKRYAVHLPPDPK